MRGLAEVVEDRNQPKGAAKGCGQVSTVNQVYFEIVNY